MRPGPGHPRPARCRRPRRAHGEDVVHRCRVRRTTARPLRTVRGARQHQGERAMTELKGSKTHNNLKDAFAGESMANRRYLFFARQAEKENITEVAELFRDTAEAETGHAFGHAEYLVGVGDPATDEPMGTTEENLASAVVGETYEFTADRKSTR